MSEIMSRRLGMSPGLIILAGLLGLTGCSGVSIEAFNVSGPRHICPGDQIDVSYRVVTVDDLLISRNAEMWRTWSNIGADGNRGRPSGELYDTLVDNPVIDTTYTIRAQGPVPASTSYPTLIRSEERDVIVGTEVKRVGFKLVGCRGAGPPSYVLDLGQLTDTWGEGVKIVGVSFEPRGSDFESIRVTHADDLRGSLTTGEIRPGEVNGELNGQHIPGEWSVAPRFVGVSLQNCLNPPLAQPCPQSTYQCAQQAYPMPPLEIFVNVHVACGQ
jgi:hypothetical protein